jgi:TfoX/Sxy family transcriptional regulator of competence genes
MPFDEKLANRVRRILEKVEGLSEKKMFGGLCFLINGNMALGLVNEDLMIRVEPESYDKLLSQPNVRKMDFTGRPLKGFLYIGAKGTESDKDLRKWVLKSVEFALSQPAKNKK